MTSLTIVLAGRQDAPISSLANGSHGTLISSSANGSQSLILGGPGRLLNHVSEHLGSTVVDFATGFQEWRGCTPRAVYRRIEDTIKEIPEETFDRLYDPSPDEMSKLQKDCSKLIEYALP